MYNCPKCGYKCEKGDNACRNCGETLKARGNSCVIIVIVFLFLVTIISVVAVFLVFPLFFDNVTEKECCTANGGTWENGRCSIESPWDGEKCR